MAAPLEKTLYIGPFIYCQSLITLDICDNGTIGVDEHGKIAFILRSLNETIPPGWDSAQTVKIKGTGFFFPGFIDTHIHASQFPNAGLFGKTTLLDWLETYTFPMESSFSDLSKAQAIYERVVQRTLSHGTTTACYYATTHVEATNLLSRICWERGQRAMVGRVCMDGLAPEGYRDEGPEEGVRKTRECLSYCREFGEMVQGIVTPRFAPSCSRESLAGLGKLAREENVRVQTHISENVKEIELVKELFPESKNYTDVYDSAGLLTEKTILAHAVHLSQEEIDVIRVRGSGISHCPASNTALTSGRCPVRTLISLNVPVGLGTDVSGGYTPSILAQAREALFTSRHLSISTGDFSDKLAVEEGLYLATAGGARVVGLEDRIGGFKVGMDWDAQMIMFDGPGKGLVELFGWESWEERVNKWVYTGDDRNTVAVWVKGRLVHGVEGFKRE